MQIVSFPFKFICVYSHISARVTDGEIPPPPPYTCGSQVGRAADEKISISIEAVVEKRGELLFLLSSLERGVYIRAYNRTFL